MNRTNPINPIQADRRDQPDQPDQPDQVQLTRRVPRFCMKTVLKWLLRLILLVVVVIAGFIGYVYWRSSALMAKTYDVEVPDVVIPTDEASIARGKHLVQKVSLCVECHGEDLGGKVIEDNFAFGHLAGSNLTRGRRPHGSTWKDEFNVAALVQGGRPTLR
jgi:hypothetical protein